MAQRVTVVKVLLAAYLALAYVPTNVASQNDTTTEEPPFQIIPVNDTFPDDVDEGLQHPGNLRGVCSSAHPLRFYVGYGCWWYTVGSIDVKPKFLGKYCRGTNVADLPCFYNNRARSMAIRPNFPAGGIIYVCDDPYNCFRDDYAKIIVKKAPSRGIYCVKSFERNLDNAFVSLEYKRKNGLNGKVSRVAACRP